MYSNWTISLVVVSKYLYALNHNALQDLRSVIQLYIDLICNSYPSLPLFLGNSLAPLWIKYNFTYHKQETLNRRKTWLSPFHYDIEERKRFLDIKVVQCVLNISSCLLFTWAKPFWRRHQLNIIRPKYLQENHKYIFLYFLNRISSKSKAYF